MVKITFRLQTFTTFVNVKNTFNVFHVFLFFYKRLTFFNVSREKHVYKRRSDYCMCVMLARESLSSSSSLQVTFTEEKCMIRMTYVAITRRGSWGRSPSDVGMVTQVSAPLLKSTSNAPNLNDYTNFVWVCELKVTAGAGRASSKIYRGPLLVGGPELKHP